MSYTNIPSSIGDIVYHSVTERNLINDIASGVKPFPSYGKNSILLWGDYGTGKTTLARLLPEAIEQSKGGSDAHYDFIRCGQGFTGPELMKQVKNRSLLISANYSRYHYFVLDEIDNLTIKAQASLKSAMGIPSTIFIMTTNFIGRVDEGVQTRSVLLNCNAAPAEAYLPIARRVLADCGCTDAEDDKLLPIISGCKGCVRDIADAMERLAARKRAKPLTTT